MGAALSARPGLQCIRAASQSAQEEVARQLRPIAARGDPARRAFPQRWKRYCATALPTYGVHLERQFTRSMSKRAFLDGAIHIDHIIPLSIAKPSLAALPHFDRVLPGSDGRRDRRTANLAHIRPFRFSVLIEPRKRGKRPINREFGSRMDASIDKAAIGLWPMGRVRP